MMKQTNPGKNSLTSNASTAISSSHHHAGSVSVGYGVGSDNQLLFNQTPGVQASVGGQDAGNGHANMIAAAAARRGNHRRTKSTHPDELNKMILFIGKDQQVNTDEKKQEPVEEFKKEFK